MCIMNNKILLLAVTALLAFACGKTDYPEYEWGPQDDTTAVKTEVFFVNTKDILEIDPAVDSVIVTLGRTINTEALSVPLTVKDPAGIFDVPSTAEFEAGAATTTIKIGLSKMELEKNYELSISIPDDFFYAYKKTSGAFSAQTNYHLNVLKQLWDEAGYCYFIDVDTICSGVVAADNVPIQQHHGTNDFRVVAPYAALVGDEYTDAPVNMMFTISKNKKDEYEFSMSSGLKRLWPSAPYALYWAPADYSDYCYSEILYDDEEKTHYIDIHSLGATLATGKLWTGARLVFYWYDCPIEFPIPEPEEGGEE